MFPLSVFNVSNFLQSALNPWNLAQVLSKSSLEKEEASSINEFQIIDLKLIQKMQIGEVIQAHGLGIG